MNSATKTNRKRFAVICIVISLAFSLQVSALSIRQVSAQTTHEVKISGLAFIPQNLTISLGDTVMWNNTDSVIHTLWFVFVDNGSTYLLSDPVLPSTTWNHTFNDSIELQYYSFDKLWITGFINIAAEVHDVAVIDMTTSKAGCFPMETVGEGYNATIYVTVENQGGFAEAFDVTVYGNASVIGAQPVALSPGENQTLAFLWDTTGWTKGNYSISGVADIVPGETDTADNTMIYGLMLVTLAGDIDGDRWVSIYDITRMTYIYNVQWPDPKWDPNVDIVESGKIDIYDIVAATYNYGDTW